MHMELVVDKLFGTYYNELFKRYDLKITNHEIIDNIEVSVYRDSCAHKILSREKYSNINLNIL